MKTLTVEFAAAAAQHVNHSHSSAGEYQGHRLAWYCRPQIADGAELHVFAPDERSKAVAVMLPGQAPHIPSPAFGRILAQPNAGERILAFADSHGRWHAPCSARHPGAGAFGPTGISAPVSKRQAHRLLSAGARLGALPDGAGGTWDCIIGNPAQIRIAR